MVHAMGVHIPDDDNNMGFLSNANLSTHYYAGGLLRCVPEPTQGVRPEQECRGPEGKHRHFRQNAARCGQECWQIGHFLDLVHERSDYGSAAPTTFSIFMVHSAALVFRTEIQMSKLVLGLLLFTHS